MAGMIRGPYKRYLRDLDPLDSMPKSTYYVGKKSKAFVLDPSIESAVFSVTDNSGNGDESARVDETEENDQRDESMEQSDTEEQLDTNEALASDTEEQLDTNEGLASDTEEQLDTDDDEKSASIEENAEDCDPLYQGSDFTTHMSLIMIMMFCLRHSLSYEAISDLLSLLKFLLPSPNAIPKSLWCFRKYIKKYSTLSPESHFYCVDCYDNIIDTSLPCSTCGSRNVPQSFTILSVESQICSMFQRKGFYDALNYRFERTTNGSCIEDIYDGSVYKHLCSCGILSSRNALSFKHNTDGIAIFRSSGKDVWPILLQINELPPNMRTKPENMILAGIWFGTSHPPINTFMKPLQETFLSLQTTGIEVKIKEELINVKAVLMSGVYDIPAKSDVLGFGSHRGEYACTRCLHPGKVIQTSKGANLRVYPHSLTTDHIRITEGTGKARVHQEILSDAIIALQDDRQCHGILDYSIMSSFLYFDFVKGVAIDSMHCLYGGGSDVPLV